MHAKGLAVHRKQRHGADSREIGREQYCQDPHQLVRLTTGNQRLEEEEKEVGIRAVVRLLDETTA